jgi:hypothetical protein
VHTDNHSIQKEAKHPETFAPQVVSLDPEHYESMVRALRLPTRAIEGTSVVGPFFWSSFSNEPGSNDPRLRTFPDSLLLLI